MDKTEREELVEALRQLAFETDSHLDKGWIISYYIHKLADILEGGTEA